MSETFEAIAKMLHEKSSSFAAEIEKIQKVNSDMKAKIQKFLIGLESMKQTLHPSRGQSKCAICFTRERQAVFVPCGHVVCSSCSSRALNRNPPRCFTCRTPIQDALRIYL